MSELSTHECPNCGVVTVSGSPDDATLEALRSDVAGKIEPYEPNPGETHSENCYLDGPLHYGCAMEQVRQLFSCLEHLVVLKELKEAEGETPGYLAEKPWAWARARFLVGREP